MNSPVIIPFTPELKSKFKDLNVEWLCKYYFVTEADDRILSNPEKIIDEGGAVLFASLHDEIIGTCALIKVSENEYEIAKMGVTEKARGMKAGQLLLQAIIEEAKRKRAKLISLDTAFKLNAAIALYTKFGFIQTSEERIHPEFKRQTFRMELSLT